MDVLLTSHDLPKWNSCCSCGRKVHKKCADRSFCRKALECDEEQPFVAAVQLLSEKSQVSLKPGGLSFYPLYITELSFFLRSFQQQIIENKALVVFFTSLLPWQQLWWCLFFWALFQNFFRKIMDMLNFCSFFAKVCSVPWRICFNRTFWIYRHVVWWAQISWTQFDRILDCRYSQGRRYALPKQGEYDPYAML